MGQPHSVRKVLRPSPGEDAAVTPVIGAILILAITIVGIAGVLFWGAPMVDRIQSQNAQAAIVGEFEDLRASSRELSVPDHSRFPTVVLPRGELLLEQGTRMMVTAEFVSGCTFRVIGWSTGVASSSHAGCPGTVTTRVYSVSLSTRIETAYVLGDQSTDWLWVASSTSTTCPANTALADLGNVCAVAWLHSSDQVTWNLESSDQERSVHFDSGAIFSSTGGTQFLEREPVIADTVTGASATDPYFGFWLRSLDAASYSSFSGTGSHQVYFSLIGNYVRVDGDVFRLRFDASGALSEAWCNALVDRNQRLPDADSDGTPDSSYKSQVADCGETATGTGIRSVCYSLTISTNDACATAPTAFAARILHAKIYTSLAV
jgi:hypothetical protein